MCLFVSVYDLIAAFSHHDRRTADTRGAKETPSWLAKICRQIIAHASKH